MSKRRLLQAFMIVPAAMGCANPDETLQRAQTPSFTKSTCALQKQKPSPQGACIPLITAPRVQNAKDLQFQARLIPKGSAAPFVDTSELIVRNQNGDIVARNANAFELNGRPCDPTISNNSPQAPSELEPGNYEAELIINGYVSNTISFSIQDDKNTDALPSLHIECLKWRSEPAGAFTINEDPIILMQYNHKEDTRISLSEALIQSNWIQDGHSHPHKGMTWMGTEAAAKGSLWSTTITADEYGINLQPGAHYAAFTFANAHSEIIQIEIAP